MLLPLHVNGLNLDSATVVAIVTGSTSLTEAQIVSGGETIVITLTNDTWVTAGATFNAQRQNIIDGITSAQSEATGWNAEVRDKEVVTAVVRTSDTVVTITLTAAPAYDVTSDENITVTIPATALTGGNAVVASPSIGVTADVPLTAVVGGHFGEDDRRKRKRRDEIELRRAIEKASNRLDDVQAPEKTAKIVPIRSVGSREPVSKPIRSTLDKQVTRLRSELDIIRRQLDSASEKTRQARLEASRRQIDEIVSNTVNGIIVKLEGIVAEIMEEIGE